ncbi:MAG TPA: PAS domain-containing sensor histidine kinase [Vicinamibacterales bacterium]|nr:PAS domain-containing sensor histidine kinase [Vicinamibacterales bacterium]
MPRAAASPLSVSGADAEAKLALTEFLLTSIDMQESARRAVDWLAAHTPVVEAAVLVADPVSPDILPVAERGVTFSTEDFSLTRDDASHPLVQALMNDAPAFIDSVPSTVQWPLTSRSAHVIPLRSEHEPPAGLLVLNSGGPELCPQATWLASVLGKQIARLYSRATLADTRFGQERMLLYSIINAVTDPILLTDTEGKLIIANGHAEKLFAAPDDSSEGWRRAVALNNMLFSAALSTSAVGETELRRELLLVDPLEGSDLLFELLSSRAKDERQGTYVVSILRNVTDLARAKEEIEESYRTLRVAQAEVRDERHRLDLIIDSVADPILVTDQEGDIVLMNAPAERLFNAPGEDDAVHRRVRGNGANLTSFVSNVLTRSGEQRYRGEIQLADPRSGRPLPVEALAGTILSEQGELMWVVTILHDLTEQIEKAKLYEQLKQGSAQLERKVQEATAELAQQNELLRRQHIALEQASALKSQFLANMSHEFRTPLNAILGYTHMLLNNVTGTATDAQRKSLSRIDSNARHLLALINDILDITRIEAGRMPLNLTTLVVPDLMNEVMAELEPIIRRSNLAVRTKIRGRLPVLRTDRQKVKQIVLNLLSNALKFTPAGSVTMSAAYDERLKCVVIEVQDTGVGIPKEDQKKVFEDFRQLDSSPARGYGGTGLGLSICRRLSQMLGGTIELESDEGRGARFTLRLPVRSKRR